MSAADNTGRRGMYFYQRCRLSVWTGGSPPQKRQCVSGPRPPLGWLGPESDRWGWMAAREGRWDAGLLHSGSLWQRIETDGRLRPLSPGQNSIYCSTSWPPVSFSAHIQTVQIRKGKKKKININMWMTEHAQCGTNPRDPVSLCDKGSRKRPLFGFAGDWQRGEGFERISWIGDAGWSDKALVGLAINRPRPSSE